MENYFKRVKDKINNMSDEEFIKLLKECGLDKCSSEDEEHNKFLLKILKEVKI